MSTDAATVAPRSLPDPLIDPADVQAAVPGLSDEDAQRCAQLATVAVSAALYPCPVPDPLPIPVYAATLSCAVRLATSSASASGGLPVVSESIGSYTYRLQAQPTLAESLVLTDDELDLLEPWTGSKTVYDVSVAGPRAAGLPVDWWQRDLDNPPDAGWPPSTAGDAGEHVPAGGDPGDVLRRTGPGALAWTPPPATTVGRWQYAAQTAAADPGDGRLRLDAADLAVVSAMFLSTVDADGNDVLRLLDRLHAGHAVTVQDRDDAGRAARYLVAAGPVGEAGWIRVPLEPVDAAGVLAANSDVLLVLELDELAEAGP